MNTPNTTNINIKNETYKRLAELKIHPRQSFDEVIQNLIQERTNNEL